MKSTVSLMPCPTTHSLMSSATIAYLLFLHHINLFPAHQSVSISEPLHSLFLLPKVTFFHPHSSDSFHLISAQKSFQRYLPRLLHTKRTPPPHLHLSLSFPCLAIFPLQSTNDHLIESHCPPAIRL